MTARGTPVRRFGESERVRLGKLFRVLGTDNVHEAEAVRGRIDSLLREFGKTWSDLIELLAGQPVAIRTDLAGDIVELGSSNPSERATARSKIADLLARHRKTWNDLADLLITGSHEAWACDPLSDAPDGVNPLDLAGYLLKQYVALKPHEYVAVSLWCLHTHAYDQFTVTPRLALRSPTADCGKTTLLDLLGRLVARPEKFDNISTAAIFRLTDAMHPTLLIDEADNLGLALQPNGRLRAVFNSGHRKGGTVAIMEHGRPRKFSTFSPLALALPDTLSGLPRTLNSRTVTITMERHAGWQPLKRFDPNDREQARVLDAAYGQILLWRDDLKHQPLDLDPAMPGGLRNRFADNWRPLISIADHLGWADRAREAMVAFAREFQDADVKILLLVDIRKVFHAKAVDRLPSTTLLTALHEMDDADWKEFRGIRGDQQPHKLKDSELASMLRDFKIRPRTIWPLNRTADSKSTKGYRRAAFEPVWVAYCAEDGTTAHPSQVNGLRLASAGTA
jgi:Protein of unknown function (DUF3631)